ncbi:hypothetical protein [Oscillatoria sp. FACHB-1406]|uniref:hypothetical protein n=1 Tax=Oscillatoria sp. FACHB-1406 TaxID=2692846 RepID=UPI0016860AF1|nr:hypothetical protein [Oscillatoria sp. FACHB-1406]MBD2580646.1 hypothetical protein [Oscillatoria sp. FACHB-1406]
MNYRIPTSPDELMALRQEPVNEELIATAIAGTIQIAREQGQSLEDLKAEILLDSGVLNGEQRRWLSELVARTWVNWPEKQTK